MISEQGIITYLKSQFPQQIGDDAAVLPLSDHQAWVITQDLLIEDIHFRKKYQSAESLAHKALHVNLSDIAAMGATPHTILLGLSIPSGDETYIRLFLEYFSAACHAANVILIGGDTTGAPKDQLFVSVTAIGSANPSQIKYRHTAHVNDIVCVAGNLGAAHIGFLALERDYPELSAYKEKFLNPVAKTQEGLWLAQQTTVHAMMDLSDGLYTDLEKLTNASNCGAIIPLEYLAPSSSFAQACQTLKLDPTETQLSGGEDYGLLFTVSPNAFETINEAFKAYFHYSLKKIGYITSTLGVIMTQEGKKTSLAVHPFSHFNY